MISKRYLIHFSFSFLLPVSVAFAHADSVSIGQHLEKHQLVQKKSITIALINPHTCASGIEAYKLLQDQLATQGDTLFYVFAGIRKKEAEHTIKEVLKIKTTNYRIITDKPLFDGLLQKNKPGYNYIVELNGATITRKQSVLEWLKIIPGQQTHQDIITAPKDSVLLDEILVSVDSESRLTYINDSIVLIYSYIYNKIYRYDIRTGKHTGTLELTDHEGLVTELYKQVFEEDPNRHAYIMSERNRNITGRMFGHRHEIEFQQALVHGNRIYALGRLTYPDTDNTLSVQTIILVYDFHSLELLDWYVLNDNFPDAENWFVSVWRGRPAYVINEQELILTLSGTREGYKGGYPYLISIRLNNHKATLGPLLDFQLPPFYKRINSYYEWIAGDIFDFQGKRYLFVYQEPFIYSLDDTGKIRINGFEETTGEFKDNGENTIKMNFFVYDIFPSQEGLSVLCKEKRDDHVWKIDYDKNFHEIRRNLFSVAEIPYAKLYKDKMFVIDDRGDDIYLFKYEFKGK